MKKLLFLIALSIFAFNVMAQTTDYSLSNLSEKYQDEPPVFFQANLDLSLNMAQARPATSNDAKWDIGPSFDVSLGVRCLNRILFAGVGTGVHSLANKGLVQMAYVPFYATARAYLPFSKNIAPYAEVNFGGYSGFSKKDGSTFKMTEADKSMGIYFKGGVGVDLWRCNVGVGYELLGASVSKKSGSWAKVTDNNGYPKQLDGILYVKLGVRLDGR